MIFETVKKAIETHVANGLAAAGNPIPVAWANAPFNQPSSGEWARVTVLAGRGVRASLGPAPREVVAGAVLVQIFAPKGKGTRKAAQIADLFAGLLRFKQLVQGGVVVDLGAASINGETEAPDHYMLVLAVDWQAHHTV
jgi:hypothetical protein